MSNHHEVTRWTPLEVREVEEVNDHTPLTDLLAEVRRLDGEATDGPWEAFGSTIGAMTGPGDCGGCSGILSPAHEPACYWSEIAGAGEADAEFIATARTGYPAALRALQVVMDYADYLKGQGFGVIAANLEQRIQEVVSDDDS